jgi:hypothetical protein
MDLTQEGPHGRRLRGASLSKKIKIPAPECILMVDQAAPTAPCWRKRSPEDSWSLERTTRPLTEPKPSAGQGVPCEEEGSGHEAEAVNRALSGSPDRLFWIRGQKQTAARLHVYDSHFPTAMRWALGKPHDPFRSEPLKKHASARKLRGVLSRLPAFKASKSLTSGNGIVCDTHSTLWIAGHG